MGSSTGHTTWRGRFIRYAPLIFWIGVIFFLSSNLGASSNTSRFIRPLLIWLFPDITESSLWLAHHYVRKAAHFTAYGILGLLSLRAFTYSSLTRLKEWRFPFALLLAALVAMADEINQSFISSRTGAAEDVLLDISGGLFALLFFYALKKCWPKKTKLLNFSPAESDRGSA